MNRQLIFELFERTNTYSAKESLSELRDLYEHYSEEYISAQDFIHGLNKMGYQTNRKKTQVKLKMKKEIRKNYFGLD